MDEKIKMLRKLAKNYLSDVSTRVKVLESEQADCEAAWSDPDVYDDYQNQIIHWEAIKMHIETVLNKTED